MTTLTGNNAPVCKDAGGRGGKRGASHDFSPYAFHDERRLSCRHRAFRIELHDKQRILPHEEERVGRSEDRL